MPPRPTAFEEALAKDFAESAIAGLKASTDGINADIHADAAYRAHLIGVMARRALSMANGG